MTIEMFFKELFEYNYHSNTKLAQSILANQPIASAKTIKLFSHILNAHHIWNSRILGGSNTFGVWDIHDPANFNRLIQLNHENTKTILESYSLEDLIPFSKVKKQKKISDVLFHIINHSTYHRGQIAMSFRKNGIEPIVTDYILFEK